MLLDFLLVTVTTWLAYLSAIKNGYVSDDIEGIEQYDGKLGAWQYGHLVKWFFYRFCQKNPYRHHFFSVFLHNINALLLYLFLLNFFPAKVCLFTSILFAVHPVNTQCVAWISGRGYLIGLFWILLGLDILVILPNVSKLSLYSPFFGLLILIFLFTYFMAIQGQFTTLMAFVILGFLGYWSLAVVGVLMSFVMGLSIVKEGIVHRTTVFKEQNLGASVTLHHKKFIVAVKTLGYYTQLCFFPKRMGLYHTYGFHYTKELEEEDRLFWVGLILLGVLIWVFFTNGFLIKLGILWYLSFICIFLNWITIHQFVSERYCYIANIGLCLILGGILVNFPIVFALVCGLYIMRTWVHLPSYLNEVSFYQSNIWNFPDSEVAFANLGVTYLKCGLRGSAEEMWLISTRINPQYDVSWYNLHSAHKARGQLGPALECLMKAVNSPLCHFKELWQKELDILNHEIEHIKEGEAMMGRLREISNNPAKKEKAEVIMKRLGKINEFVNSLNDMQKKNIKYVQQEESSLKVKEIQLKKVKEQVEKPFTMEQLVEERDRLFNEIKILTERLENDGT